MTQHHSHWNRREFVQRASASLGAIGFGPSWIARIAPAAISPRFAYVGFGGEGADTEGIAVFDIQGSRWKQTSAAASRAPASLTLDPSQRFLYAVNAIDEHQGLPTGTVEAYAIDSAMGSLELLNRQRLSLSATRPKHAAISPDGKTLLVAIHGGGAYNILPLKEDGSLGPVAGILKETGSGPHEDQASAHPQMVAFDRKGRALTADLGNDRLSILNIDTTQPAFAARHHTKAGEGPRQIAFHPDGELLFVANGLHPSIVCYAYNATEGKITERLTEVSTSDSKVSGGVLMAMDPSGELLYTAHPGMNNGVSIWTIEPRTAQLRKLQVVDEGMPRLHELTVTPDGNNLLGLSREAGAIFGWPVAYGSLGRRMHLAHIPAPLSVATKSL